MRPAKMRPALERQLRFGAEAVELARVEESVLLQTSQK